MLYLTEKLRYMSSTDKYVQTNKTRFLNELIEFLNLQSVSADKKYADDVLKTAEWVKKALEDSGAENVEVCPTKGFPIVYGEKIVDESLPTVLAYGHYDVQPSDPDELWESPPFEPVIKDEKIYARGASDDKGQVYMHVKALEYMVENDALPCNIKFIIEGEEEVGSPSLIPFITENKEKLSCDKILISDTAMLSNDTPSITTGLKGISYMEVEVIGPNRDLHSGIYGGAVANPVNILCQMIEKLQDENNKVTIPGFYDDVEDVPREERNAIARTPFDLEKYKDAVGIKDVHGEEGFSTLERTGIRPTLDVNGIWGGYIGEGAKTVLPSKAQAKISMRLVPDQNSEKITQMFKDYFPTLAPDSVKVKVTEHHGGEPYVTPIDDPGYIAASKAISETFGKEPVPVRTGGSIPIVKQFEEILGVKSILMGFGLDSDAIHSPNESFGIFNYLKGIETIPLFYKYYAEQAQ